MTTTTCSCGNFGCGVRIARGLAPFCKMPAPAPGARDYFLSYGAAAAACKPGQRVWRIGHSMDGGPRRFGITGAR